MLEDCEPLRLDAKLDTNFENIIFLNGRNGRCMLGLLPRVIFGNFPQLSSCLDGYLFVSQSPNEKLKKNMLMKRMNLFIRPSPNDAKLHVSDDSLLNNNMSCQKKKSSHTKWLTSQQGYNC